MWIAAQLSEFRLKPLGHIQTIMDDFIVIRYPLTETKCKILNYHRMRFTPSLSSNFQKVSQQLIKGIHLNEVNLQE